MNIEWYVVLSSLLFAIGAMGILIRRSPIVILLCLELMLNAGNLALVAFSRMVGNQTGRSSRSSSWSSPPARSSSASA